MYFGSSKWKYIRYDIEVYLKNLRLRELIDRNPKAVLGLTVISLLAFTFIVIGQLIPDSPKKHKQPDTVWFYDLNTNQLFTANRSKLPPIKAPSGPLPDGTPAGVRAYLFDSNDPNRTEPVIGFLEKFSPEGKIAQKDYDPAKHNAQLWAAGRFFLRLSDEKWVKADSLEGRKIYKNYYLDKEK